MYIFSSFELNVYLELALTELEQKGVAKEKILAVPLDKRRENRQLFDSIDRADGISLIDTGAVLATALAVVGASLGFRLPLGPIVWGIAGALCGFLLGFTFDLLRGKTMSDRRRQKTAEVIVIVQCPPELIEVVEKTLWEHEALGVARLQKQAPR